MTRDLLPLDPLVEYPFEVELTDISSLDFLWTLFFVNTNCTHVDYDMTMSYIKFQAPAFIIRHLIDYRDEGRLFCNLLYRNRHARQAN